MVDSNVIAPQKKGRKLTYDFVKTQIEQTGFTLLSLEYKAARILLDLRCPEKHEIKLSWNDFQQGGRCSVCSGKSVNLVFVKSFSEANGFSLLSDRYESTNKPLSFRCQSGHVFNCTWNNMRQRKRCPECDRVAIVVTFSDVERLAAIRGLTLLSDIYVNNQAKMNFVCSEGHSVQKSWSHLSKLKSATCPICSVQSSILRLLNLEGYSLLSYAGSHQFMTIECPEKHLASMYPGSFRAGSRCVRCVRGGMTSEEVSEQLRVKNRIAGSVRKLIVVKSRRSKGSERAPFSRLVKQTSADILKVLGIRPDGHDLDHIVPQAFFDFRYESEIEACWAIDNLRYLPSLENQTRRHILTLEEVDRFTTAQLEILTIASLKPQRWIEYVSDVSQYCVKNQVDRRGESQAIQAKDLHVV